MMTDLPWRQGTTCANEARTTSCVDVRWRRRMACSELKDGATGHAHIGVVQLQSTSRNTRSERSRLTAAGAWQIQGICGSRGSASLTVRRDMQALVTMRERRQIANFCGFNHQPTVHGRVSMQT